MEGITLDGVWSSSPSPELCSLPGGRNNNITLDQELLDPFSENGRASVQDARGSSPRLAPFQLPIRANTPSDEKGCLKVSSEEDLPKAHYINHPSNSTQTFSPPIDRNSIVINEGASKSSEQGISLREWISGALDSVDVSSHNSSNPSSSAAFGCDLSTWPPEVRKALALVSEPFLLSALRVAYSLADQLVQAENSYNHNKLPTPGSNWAEHVIVHLAQPQRRGMHSGNPSHFSSHADLQQKTFTSNNKTFDTCTGDEKIGNDDVCRKINYLSVSGAEFSQPVDNAEASGKAESRLYSLGLVFYELFSGGKKPPELSAAKSSRHKFRGQDDCFDPLPVDRNRTETLDLTSALYFLNDFGADDSENLVESHGESNFDCAPTGKKARGSLCNEGKSVAEMNSISVEPLRMQRLPNSLCDLIHNMVDCVKGDLRGDESYSRMQDVQTDLSLMLEKPNKFMRGPDIDKIAISGLQLNDAVFGREAEYSSLVGAYDRSNAGDNEMAIILGPSGTGKSVLAHRLSQAATLKGGIFLSGKFDLLSQPKPLSAIAAAFNEYCDLLAQQMGSALTNEFAFRLRETFGQEIFSLMKIIPNVGKIINQEIYPSIQQDSVDATRRLHYLLCQFMGVICSASSAPVTLFLDDLQWADSASVSVVVELLLMSGSSQNQSKFFFLGCCRDDNISEGHPVKAILSGIQNFRIRTTTIRLSCFEKDVINTMVSDLLCLSPRLTRSLSELVYHKTKGNPLFFSNLMVSLSKEGVLRINLARRRWEWDEALIQSRSLPDDVALFFTSMIEKLPNEAQTAMSALACFGASTDCSLVEQLQEKLGVQLLSPLEIAVTEGFLLKSNGEFRFSHDRVQEASYNLIDPSIRHLVHFKYGLALSSGIEETENSPYLFSLVGQLNRGGPAAVTDENQGVFVAKLNLVAGDQAIEMSDFSSAFYFFENGISFLPENHWNCHYAASLNLYDRAVKCSLVIANFAALKLLSKQVMIHAKSFEDKLKTLYVAICSLAYTSKLPQLIEKGKSILSQLGENLPDSFIESDFDFYLKQTKDILSEFMVDSTRSYEQMTDFSKIMAMKFLSSLQIVLLFLRPEIQPFVTLKMVNLSLVHGMSSVSPLGFAYYGSLLGRLGDIKEGYHYTKVAKDLLQKIGSKEVSGPLYVISTQVMFAVEPMQAANEYFLEGHDLALSVGDMENAMLNISLNACNKFWVGTNLQTVKNKLDDAGYLMKRNSHSTWLADIILFKKTILMLIGRSSNCVGPHQIDDIFFENQNEFEVEVLDKNPHMQLLSYFHDMHTSFIFRKYDDMKYYAEKYFKNKRQWQILYFNSLMHNFIDGLVSFWIYRKSGDKLWLQRGSQSLSEVRRWAETSNWNFLNNLSLLEAEESFCNKCYASAASSYKKSIALARDHRFIHEEALANELMGYFLSDVNEEDASAQYLIKASENYDEWGALAKAAGLRRCISEEINFGSLDSSSRLASLGSNASLVDSDQCLQERDGEKIIQKRPSSLV